MLKALFKKQMAELNTFFYQNKKTGKRRSKGGVIGMIVLYAFLMIILAFTFGMVAISICEPLCALGLDWLYFAIMGLMAIMLGVFGSVFNTYSGIFHAKDNELLLSMPIPPKNILLVRMLGVFLWAFIYEALIMVPSIIVWAMFGNASAIGVIFSIVTMLIMTFFIVSLACVLGWVVALIARKVKNKSFVTVFLTILFLAGYYYVYFKAAELLQTFMLNVNNVGEGFMKWAYPMYKLGLSCTGDFVSLLIVAVMIAIVFAITYYVISGTFIKISTASANERKNNKKEISTKSNSVQNALFKKELKRFTGSATYMLNCGLGIFLMPILAIVMLVKADYLREFLDMAISEMPMLTKFISIIIVGIVCMMSSMIDITSPSISLEGKSLWILQSMPVPAWEILKAKLRLHITLALTPALILEIVSIYVFKIEEPLELIAMVILTDYFIRFQADLGLTLNLKMPNLTWTNEAIPVKQGMPVIISLFGGWVLTLILGGIFYFVNDMITPIIYLIACAVVFLALSMLLEKWLRTKGSKIFENL